jgi:hypothetical protein
MINRKGRGRKQSCHNFKVLDLHLPGGNEKNHEKSLRIACLRVAEI